MRFLYSLFLSFTQLHHSCLLSCRDSYLSDTEDIHWYCFQNQNVKCSGQKITLSDEIRENSVCIFYISIIAQSGGSEYPNFILTTSLLQFIPFCLDLGIVLSKLYCSFLIANFLYGGPYCCASAIPSNTLPTFAGTLSYHLYRPFISK